MARDLEAGDHQAAAVAVAEVEEAPPLRRILARLGQGELGSLPVIVGLVLIWGIFQVLNSNFLTPRNLTNLLSQVASTGTISVGIVLVLLLGEIDLSVGSVSGVCAGVVAVLQVKQGVSVPVSVLAGLVTGAVIGALQGTWFTYFRIPSFVVTLAGLLAWQGLLIFVLGTTGTINLLDPGFDAIAGTLVWPALGWVVAVIGLAVYAGSVLRRRWARSRAGLEVPGYGGFLARFVIAALVVAAAVWVLNSANGIPLAGLLLVVFVVLFEFVVRRTAFGRHVLAVGGNDEASRRAGINVSFIRIAVFTLASTMAAAGGIIGASRLLAVNQSSGSGDVLLNAIAAAVIGGTSLFGGRGTVWSALTGMLVIGSISNGMDLIALPSSIKYMVTGGVLLAAVTLDAVARRGRESAGRA